MKKRKSLNLFILIYLKKKKLSEVAKTAAKLHNSGLAKWPNCNLTVQPNLLISCRFMCHQEKKPFHSGARLGNATPLKQSIFQLPSAKQSEELEAISRRLYQRVVVRSWRCHHGETSGCVSRWSKNVFRFFFIRAKNERQERRGERVTVVSAASVGLAD